MNKDSFLFYKIANCMTILLDAYIFCQTNRREEKRKALPCIVCLDVPVCIKGDEEVEEEER